MNKWIQLSFLLIGAIIIFKCTSIIGKNNLDNTQLTLAYLGCMALTLSFIIN